ncbi:hypothetical protein FWC63_02150 [Candidatus Saccharibacteria bacterium]|nr:hypothetical protein [Candidatus Saccharibacteria bacterium]
MAAKKGIQSTKRASIDKANYLMFLSIAAVSALVAVTVIAVDYLSKMIRFQSAVNDEKLVALNITEANLANFEIVVTDIYALRENDNLLAVAETVNQAHIDEPLRVVANAMPAFRNLAAFGASIADLTIHRVGGNEAVVQSIAVGRDTTVTPVLETTAERMNVTFQVVGALGCDGNATACDQPVGISQILSNLERSIRPVEINSATFFFRSEGLVELTVQANGFFTSDRTVNKDLRQLTGAAVLNRPRGASAAGPVSPPSPAGGS